MYICTYVLHYVGWSYQTLEVHAVVAEGIRKIPEELLPTFRAWIMFVMRGMGKSRGG